MEEYNNNNEPQGELFNEIYKENLSPHGSSNKYDGKRPFRISFDKFLLLLIVLIIIGTVAYIVGFRHGKNADPIRSELVSTERYIVIDDEDDIIDEMREDSRDVPTREEEVSDTADEKTPEVSDPIVASPGEDFLVDDAHKNWTIQLVTYTSEKYAINEMDRLRENGYEPFLIPSGKFYQVCVNRFSTKEEANKLLQVFKSGSRYRDAFLRHIKR